jgi:hypothetical protein
MIEENKTTFDRRPIPKFDLTEMDGIQIYEEYLRHMATDSPVKNLFSY